MLILSLIFVFPIPIVDCQWQEWSGWSNCVAIPNTCGESAEKRSRTKVNPRFGGKPCVGPKTDEQPCGRTSGGDNKP